MALYVFIVLAIIGMAALVVFRAKAIRRDQRTCGQQSP